MPIENIGTPGVAPALPSVDDLALLGVPAHVADGLRNYLHALNDADVHSAESKGYTFGGKLDGVYRTNVFVVDPKQTSAGKYLRVLSLDTQRTSDGENGQVTTSGSIHAFVEKATGNVAKPAGWNGPVKSTAKATKGQIMWRFTVTDQTTWPAFDVHGGYLYKR